jgi:hypothetical protein
VFKRYTKSNNQGVFVGFIITSDCSMAGEHIALLRLLRLQNALKSTINSSEFLSLKKFQIETAVLNNNNFWKYLFVMCCILYAPMHVLRLADQQSPAMDKLYYYVLQTDWMLLKYLPSAEIKSRLLLEDSKLNSMMAPNGVHWDDNDDEILEDESQVDSDEDSNDKGEGDKDDLIFNDSGEEEVVEDDDSTDEVVDGPAQIPGSEQVFSLLH